MPSSPAEAHPQEEEVLGDENESQCKRAPLKEKNEKNQKAARHLEKTKRSPGKKKFGVSPNPKRGKKDKKKLVQAALEENADIGDENGGGADGLSRRTMVNVASWSSRRVRSH